MYVCRQARICMYSYMHASFVSTLRIPLYSSGSRGRSLSIKSMPQAPVVPAAMPAERQKVGSFNGGLRFGVSGVCRSGSLEGGVSQASGFRQAMENMLTQGCLRG